MIRGRFAQQMPILKARGDDAARQGKGLLAYGSSAWQMPAGSRELTRQTAERSADRLRGLLWLFVCCVVVVVGQFVDNAVW